MKDVVKPALLASRASKSWLAGIAKRRVVRFKSTFAYADLADNWRNFFLRTRYIMILRIRLCFVFALFVTPVTPALSQPVPAAQRVLEIGPNLNLDIVCRHNKLDPVITFSFNQPLAPQPKDHALIIQETPTSFLTIAIFDPANQRIESHIIYSDEFCFIGVYARPAGATITHSDGNYTNTGDLHATSPNGDELDLQPGPNNIFRGVLAFSVLRPSTAGVSTHDVYVMNQSNFIHAFIVSPTIVQQIPNTFHK